MQLLIVGWFHLSLGLIYYRLCESVWYLVLMQDGGKSLLVMQWRYCILALSHWCCSYMRLDCCSRCSVGLQHQAVSCHGAVLIQPTKFGPLNSLWPGKHLWHFENSVFNLVSRLNLFISFRIVCYEHWFSNHLILIRQQIQGSFCVCAQPMRDNVTL